jgi:probable phosphoglycerate mutase
VTHLYLIRHGNSIEDLKDGTYQDLGLSSEGVRQVTRLRDRLARTSEIQADMLVASPLRRARESAELLAPALGQSITVDDELQEWRCDDGRLSPAAFNAHWQRVTEEQRPYIRWMAGYETWLEFAARVQQALNRLIQEHEGKTLVIVTHGGVIQASFVHFFGLNAANTPGIAADYASITHWSRPDGGRRWILHGFNDAQHA